MKMKLFILAIILTSCQYKPERFFDNIYPAYWRYELNSELSQSDNEKLLFISRYIDKYPNVDSSFLNNGNLLITDIESHTMEKRKGSIERSKPIALFKEDYRIIVNYKSKCGRSYNGGHMIVGIRHHITIIYSGLKDAKPFIPSMDFEWYYDKKSKKWILESTDIWARGNGHPD